MGTHCLSMIDPPNSHGYAEDAVLMPMEDGSLGLAGSTNSSIYEWSRKVMSSSGGGGGDGGVAPFFFQTLNNGNSHLFNLVLVTFYTSSC
jgi:hypothetical protein